MIGINRINYRTNLSEISDFEIVDLQFFFSIRPKRLLEKDYRLNFWEIIYIIEGKGTHYIDFKPIDYKKGDILFVQKNQVHRFKVNKKVKGYIIHINEPFLLKLDNIDKNVFFEFIDQSFGSPVVSVDNNINSTNRQLIDIIYKECNSENNVKDDILIKSLFESFILSVKQQSSHNKQIFESSSYKLFRQCRDLVEKNYSKHLTIEEYAKMLGVSKKTINKATRAIVDMSAKEFVNNRLFLEIKRYLSQGELMNYEIADILGFDEPSNMTNFFKKYEGLSPKDFRKKINANSFK